MPKDKDNQGLEELLPDNPYGRQELTASPVGDSGEELAAFFGDQIPNPKFGMEGEPKYIDNPNPPEHVLGGAKAPQYKPGDRIIDPTTGEIQEVKEDGTLGDLTITGDQISHSPVVPQGVPQVTPQTQVQNTDDIDAMLSAAFQDEPHLAALPAAEKFRIAQARFGNLVQTNLELKTKLDNAEKRLKAGDMTALDDGDYGLEGDDYGTEQRKPIPDDHPPAWYLKAEAERMRKEAENTALNRWRDKLGDKFPQVMNGVRYYINQQAQKGIPTLFQTPEDYDAIFMYVSGAMKITPQGAPQPRRTPTQKPQGLTPTQELEQDLVSGLSEAELKRIKESGRKPDLPMTDYEKSKRGIENALLRGKLWDEETKSWI